MTDNMCTLLESFGYDTHTARLVAGQADEHGLTLTDVAGWIREALCSSTIRNPRAFVRASIARGDKPPGAPPPSRPPLPDFHEQLNLLCPDCQTRPCVCDWDPETESFTNYRERIINPTGGTDQ